MPNLTGKGLLGRWREATAARARQQRVHRPILERDSWHLARNSRETCERGSPALVYMFDHQAVGLRLSRSPSTLSRRRAPGMPFNSE